MAGETGHIEIIVGARADSSLATIFGQIPKQAEKARAGVDRALNKPGSAFKGYEADSSKAANRMVADQTRAVLAVARMRAREEAKGTAERIANEKRAAAEELRSRKALAAEENRLARTQQQQQSYWKRARDSSEMQRSREAARQQAKQERESSRSRDALEKSFAYRTAYHGLIRYAPGALHRGARVANDIIRGAGVDLNVGSSVGRSVSLENEAAKLSNSAFMAGAKGPSGKRVSPAELAAFARSAAIASGNTSEDTMGAMREFVGRTGDLETAKASMPGLMKLAKAYGTNPADMMKFAGTTGATWYDAPAASAQEAQERAADLEKVMRIGASGGKLGTVEFEHLAKYGPKLAASAQAFEGDKTKNLAEMMALAQMGLAGGAATPSIATTAVASMVNTLRTPARMAKFGKSFESAEKNDPLFAKTFGKGFGLETGKGTFRSASDIILASIMAAGTDTKKFKGEWMNVQGARAVEGLRAKYLKAGGGEAGVAAVRGEFAKYGGTVGNQEVNDSFDTAMQTSASKAALFQENLDKVVSEMAGKVLPALAEMAPNALKVAKFMGDAVGWVAGNPGAAIAAAIGLSIARAGLESVLRIGLENVLTRTASKVAGLANRVTGAAGQVAGTTGAIVPGGKTVKAGASGANLIGAGVVGLTIGSIIAEEILTRGITSYDTNSKKANAAASFLAKQSEPGAVKLGLSNAKQVLSELKNDKTAAVFDLVGAGSAPEIKMLEKLIADREAELNTGGVYNKGGTVKTIASEAKGPTPVSLDPGALQPLQDEIRAQRTGTQRVEVTNLPTAPGSALEPPRVSPAGRAAPP